MSLDVRRERLLEVGETMFANKLFLVVALEARHAQRFFQSQFGCDCGSALRRLETAGMIKRTKRQPGDYGYGTVWYEVTKSPYWRVITMIHGALLVEMEERREASKKSKAKKRAASVEKRKQTVLAELGALEAGLRS